MSQHRVPTVLLRRGRALTVLADLPDDHFHSVVCDPPYGLSQRLDVTAMLTDWLAEGDHVAVNGGGLMGNQWDAVVPGPDTWRAVLAVLRPGGYCLAFGGPRTADLTAMSMRLAGFDIIDQIVWLHGNGWAKSRDQAAAVTKASGDRAAADQWAGWGTALKPANEPILVARKPSKTTVARNLLAEGCGALNIDATRIGDVGRHPANVVLAHEPGCDAGSGSCDAGCVVATLDAQTGTMKRRGNRNPTRSGGGGQRVPAPQQSVIADHGPGDSGGASRFFYCAKPSQAERHAGLDGAENPHPSVKPVELMRWLIRLVAPADGIVLDPFCGSGSTLVAATLEGVDSVGVDSDDDGIFLPVAAARAVHAGASVNRPGPTGPGAGRPAA